MARICKDHWSALRKAIEVDRGMAGLVAKSGEEAHAALVRQLQGEDRKTDFDPLMNANWAIHSAYLHDVGLAAFDGEKCPLCEVEKSRSGLAQDWIEGAAEEQLVAARQLGLMPAVQ